jgi:hypothetical protein
MSDQKQFDEFKGDIEVEVYWGIKNYDASEVPKLDPKQLGEVEFEPMIDIQSSENRNALLDFCKLLRYQKFAKEVNCWIEDLQEQDFADLWNWATQT